MRKTIAIIFLFLSVFIMLLFPGVITEAVSKGLRIWYQGVLPALLPFSIVSNVLIGTNLFYYITDRLYPLLFKLHFPFSREGIFPFFCGFLFGFPMGSKITADLLKKGLLEKEEADILFIVTNNISPMFICGYALSPVFYDEKAGIIVLISVYLPPLITGLMIACRSTSSMHKKERSAVSHHGPGSYGIKKAVPPAKLSFAAIDTAIMNAFETMVKLGGYIILFSIAAAFVNLFIGSFPVYAGICTGVLEITNGMDYLAPFLLPMPTKLSIISALLSFGGISGLFQTASMIRGTVLSLKKYVIYRLIFASCAVCIIMLLSAVCFHA